LYAKIGTSEFARFHQTLSGLAKIGHIRYVFRHFARNTGEAQNSVGLSGYGVELAIKNTEYKAVDDSAGQEDSNEDQEIHGFDFGTLRLVIKSLYNTITFCLDLTCHISRILSNNLKRICQSSMNCHR
jgi:UDP-glucose:glycoprotein glucosyltransferase